MMTELAIIIGALVCSAFFSGSEIAFVASNRLRVAALAQRRGFVGKLVMRFLEVPERSLTTTLVGNNIALVTYSTVMALLLTEPLGQFYVSTVGITEPAPRVVVLVTQSLIAGLIVLLIGEVLPKAVARASASHAVFVLALPLSVAYRLLKPLVVLATKASHLLLRLLRTGNARHVQLPRRQFELIIEESRKQGSLDLNKEESEILSNVLELRAKRVKESMTPRTDIIAVDEGTSIEELRAQCIKSGYSKIPVYQNNIDTIVGIAFAHDLFKSPRSLKEIIRPAKFVPEAKPSKELFREFRDTSSSIGIVIDEYGGTAGLITREDHLEELFGDIQDEFDSDDVVVRQLGSGVILASGRAEINVLNEDFGLSLPTGDYETVAGYILEMRGTIPDTQEEFTLGDCHFVIQQASTHRIDLVRIRHQRGPAAAHATDPR